MNKTIRKFDVVPNIPTRLLPLIEIANNLFWVWTHDASALLLRIDRELWEQESNNPIRVLCRVSQERLEDLSKDESFLNHMDRVYSRYKEYLSSRSWFDSNYPQYKEKVFAYFSAEFGLSETIPIYSGGLGMLAGDHMKSTSDLGLPLCGVGLLYREGYFRQYLNPDGWQQETYPQNEFFMMPIKMVTDEKGEPVKISVNMLNGPLYAQVWKINVGRAAIYLLDANIPDNPEHYREITSRLYGGDNEMRIKQEILLGIGGIRALYKINKIPCVTHMNEGHSAFLALERIRFLMEEHKLKFDEARELVMASNIFTTHTPVPAGNDRFPNDLITRYFTNTNYVTRLGLTIDELLKLGEEPLDHDHPERGTNFCMTVLALNLASYNNGVSKLHGRVSRNMWHWMWNDHEVSEVPIRSITNGVHARTWISHDMAGLFDRYLGPRWIDDPWDHTIWSRIEDIPATELWHTHERRRERLVAFVRSRLRMQLERRGVRGAELEVANEVLDPDALTIGFARRFATYKRATLLLREPDRLTRILTNKKRPVQIIFAGKAHPRDDSGKAFIREIYRIARKPELRRHIVFLEDYDMVIARHLVQGVDIWLNNPRRPLEASGTSGMKVCFNGGINVSIMDGWWDEAYNWENGWAIGAGEDYLDDHEYQDSVESKALYQIMEDEIVPLFYKRGTDDLPKGWVDVMKKSMMSNCPVYNTNRMVQEYTTTSYVPALEFSQKLYEDDFKKSKTLAKWRKKVVSQWKDVKILSVDSPDFREIKRGGKLEISASLDLGGLGPDDVCVSIYYGNIDFKGNIIDGKEMVMKHSEGSGPYKFKGTINCYEAGEFGYTVRVMADHVDLSSRFHFGKIVWG
ncbi:MAG: alpha-glucan family phosphorylase [Oligoflexia bacterium]|nr:alpha-glucan family phosphorylase [Oligoflexia bacterium]